MSAMHTNLLSSTADIRIKHLLHNLEVISSTIPPGTNILPMVKANAYGHGLEIIHPHLSQTNIAGLGVATLSEAITLRDTGFKKDILCFGGINGEVLERADYHHVQVVLHSREDIHTYLQSKARPRFHLELETGMHRLGIQVKAFLDIPDIKTDLAPYIVGIFSHFAQSEIPNDDFTQVQMDTFQKQSHQVAAFFQKDLILHMGNSGSILHLDYPMMDWVRPGLALYGYDPKATSLKAHEKANSTTASAQNKKLKPVLTWKAPIIQTKTLSAGDHVGYGCYFQAQKKMTIATIAAGYGDGFMRSYHNIGVGYQERRCDIVGPICMDFMMIDVTDLNHVNLGDQVYLLGDGRHGEATADDIAKVDQTISYEVLSRIGSRVARIIK